MYNLHPAYLLWGKDYYPIFWVLWEHTPAGATLHEINEGIDQGKIV
jgi:methionyl-tRNA formyltransferase